MASDLELMYRRAMMNCLKPWYEDTCRRCRSEFLVCLEHQLNSIN